MRAAILLTLLALLLSTLTPGCGGSDSNSAADAKDSARGPEVPAEGTELSPRTGGEDEWAQLMRQRARAAVSKLGMVLKQELRAAMEAGGPEAALHVCNTKASEVTEALCAESGFDVGRVSTRWRNPDNAPDALEAKYLATFESDPSRGEILVRRPGGGMLYMKPIRIQSPLCLNCHGTPEDLADGVAARLAKLYPEDRATGFALGDLRGAFSVKMPGP